MSFEEPGPSRGEAGFGVIEGLVAAALLAILISSLSTMIVLFGRRITESRLEQSMRSDIHSLLQTFSVAASCRKQIEIGWGKSFPIPLDQMTIPFERLTFAGQEVKPGLLLPGQARARLLTAQLTFTQLPLPLEKIARGKLIFEFQLDASSSAPAAGTHQVRRAERSVFFHLDSVGRITSCADTISYHVMEWQERLCSRMAGAYNNGDCDLANSGVVKKATCGAIGLGYSGGALCEI